LVSVSELPLNAAQVRAVLADLLFSPADLPWVLDLAAEEFQDQVASAGQGPFETFDLDAAGWRGDLERFFIAAQFAEQLLDDPDAIEGVVLALQVRVSYFDDAEGAAHAMGILASATMQELTGAGGPDEASTDLVEFSPNLGDAARGARFTSPPGTLASPIPLRTDVIAFQRGRILAGVVIVASGLPDSAAVDLASALDARLVRGLAQLPAGESDPRDAEQSTARAAMEDAQSRWRSAGYARYQFRFVRFCECPEAWSGPFNVTVGDGIVTAFEREGGPTDPDAATTVDALFADVAAAIDRGDRVAVSYDPTDGHPTTVRLNLDAIPVDGGLVLDILDLHAESPTP
jgi:hypothetical protein